MPNYPSLLFLLTILAIINPIRISSASAQPPTTTTPSAPPPSQPPPLPTPPPSPSPAPPFPFPTPPLPPPPPPPQPPPSLPPPTPHPLPLQQVNNIIDALIGAGDFTNWANIISMINPVTLPMSATLFIPQGESLNRTPNMDPFLVPYHIVPQRLSFSDLRLLNTNTRLPTLLPGKSILITNTSASNFTLDDSPITQPDVYSTTALAVHAIAFLLDYALYGDGFPQPEVVTPAPASPLAPGPPITFSSSNAARLCTEFPYLLLIVCALLSTFKTSQSQSLR